MFHIFPYTNFHEINLDWILKKIKSVVYSVNGQFPDDDGNIELEVTSGVQSINNKTGVVTLDASDVGALPDNYTPPVTSVNGETGAVVLDASDFGAVETVNNIAPDSNGNVNVGTVKSVNNSTPDANGNVNLPAVSGVTSVCGVGADAQGNVAIDASDVGALPDNYTPPVTSVNGETGAVVLDASDVGALPDNYTPPVVSVNGETGAVVLDASDVGALPDSYTPPVASVNGDTGAVVLDASDVGAEKAWNVVWTNQSPSASFSAQTVTYNGTNYDEFRFCFSRAAGSALLAVDITINLVDTYLTGVQASALVDSSNHLGRRFVTDITRTSCAFAAGFVANTYGGSGTQDNTVLVPLIIYGR